jgi:hypothetical protein
MRSRLKLLGVFVLLLLPLVMVLGPMRKFLYPPMARELTGLVDLTPPPFAVFAEGGSLPEGTEATEPLRAAYEEQDYARISDLLERVPLRACSPELRLLSGVVYTLQKRPGPALVQLADVRAPGDGELQRVASWFTAQAYLLLCQGQRAGEALAPLAREKGTYHDQAVALSRRLGELSPDFVEG